MRAKNPHNHLPPKKIRENPLYPFKSVFYHCGRRRSRRWFLSKTPKNLLARTNPTNTHHQQPRKAKNKLAADVFLEDLCHTAVFNDSGSNALFLEVLSLIYKTYSKLYI